MYIYKYKGKRTTGREKEREKALLRQLLYENSPIRGGLRYGRQGVISSALGSSSDDAARELCYWHRVELTLNPLLARFILLINTREIFYYFARVAVFRLLFFYE